MKDLGKPWYMLFKKIHGKELKVVGGSWISSLSFQISSPTSGDESPKCKNKMGTSYQMRIDEVRSHKIG